jgi:hypothetical protein
MNLPHLAELVSLGDFEVQKSKILQRATQNGRLKRFHC